MRLALIPPISLLDYTLETDYQLMLPHLLKDSEYYEVYWKLCKDTNTYVIFDNGVAEGVPSNWDHYMSTAYNLNPQEIVLPDILGNAEATCNTAIEFMNWAGSSVLAYNIMFVVQGQNYEEFLKCAQFAADRTFVHTIGIPRHMLTACKDKYARMRLAQALITMGCEKEVHFLGANSSFVEEGAVAAARKYPNVRGMDTSLPFNYTYANKRVSCYAEIDRPENYFGLARTAFDSDLLDENVSTFVKWVTGAGAGA